MFKTIKKGKKPVVAPIAILIGVLTSLLVTMVGMVLLTQLQNSTAIGENALITIRPIIWFFSTFLGCTIAAVIADRQYLLICSMTAAVYFGLLVIVSALFLESGYDAIGVGIISIAVGIVPAIMFFFRKNNAKKTKIKYRKI